MQNLEKRISALEGAHPTGLEARTDAELDARIAVAKARLDAEDGREPADEVDERIAVHRARIAAETQPSGQKDGEDGKY